MPDPPSGWCRGGSIDDICRGTTSARPNEPGAPRLSLPFLAGRRETRVLPTRTAAAGGRRAGPCDPGGRDDVYPAPRSRARMVPRKGESGDRREEPSPTRKTIGIGPLQEPAAAGDSSIRFPPYVEPSGCGREQIRRFGQRPHRVRRLVDPEGVRRPFPRGWYAPRAVCRSVLGRRDQLIFLPATPAGNLRSLGCLRPVGFPIFRQVAEGGDPRVPPGGRGRSARRIPR